VSDTPDLIRQPGVQGQVKAINRLDALAGEVLAVLVQVNESGSDHTYSNCGGSLASWQAVAPAHLSKIGA